MNKTVVIRDSGKTTVVGNVPEKHVDTVTHLVQIQNDLDRGVTPRADDLSFEEKGDLLRQMGNLFGVPERY